MWIGNEMEGERLPQQWNWKGRKEEGEKNI